MRHPSALSRTHQNHRRILLFRFIRRVLTGMLPVVVVALVGLFILSFFDPEEWRSIRFLRGFAAFLVAYTVGFSVFAITYFYYYLLTDEQRRSKWTQPSSVGDLDEVYRSILAELRKPPKR